MGLVLSGGVARGIAHIGVIKVLEKYKIPVDFIAATSSGALIGVLYAAGMRINQMEKAALRLGWSRLISVVMARHGLVSSDEMQKFIIKNVGDLKFSDLKIPFAVVATDLRTGREVVLREGKVAPAVASSCSVPGVFVPIKHGEDLLIDGGLSNNVPSSVAKNMGANFIIAIDVVPGQNLGETPKNALQIFGRAFDLAIKKLSIQGRQMADVLIEPEIPQDIMHVDVDKAKRLIEIGERATEGRILEIKTRLTL